jgi:hypothetical protein
MPQSIITASIIQAFFPDGKQVNYTTDDINYVKSSRERGDVILVLKQGATDEIRLYLTSPEHDWRRNVTYSWQLSMAWMHTASDYSDNETGWYYWNVENNINSQIKGFSSTPLFSAESVTIHFKPYYRAPRSQKPLSTAALQGTLVMKHVQLGAQLTENITDLKVFRPCQAAVCEIVDGLVTVESMGNAVVSETTELLHGLPIYVVTLALLLPLFVAFVVVIRCIQRRKNKPTQQYAPIEEEEEVAEDYADETSSNTNDVEDEFEASTSHL